MCDLHCSAFQYPSIITCLLYFKLIMFSMTVFFAPSTKKPVLDYHIVRRSLFPPPLMLVSLSINNINTAWWYLVKQRHGSDAIPEFRFMQLLFAVSLSDATKLIVLLKFYAKKPSSSAITIRTVFVLQPYRNERLTKCRASFERKCPQISAHISRLTGDHRRRTVDRSPTVDSSRTDQRSQLRRRRRRGHSRPSVWPSWPSSRAAGSPSATRRRCPSFHRWSLSAAEVGDQRQSAVSELRRWPVQQLSWSLAPSRLSSPHERRVHSPESADKSRVTSAQLQGFQLSTYLYRGR